MLKLFSGLAFGLNLALTTAQTYEGFLYQPENTIVVNYGGDDGPVLRNTAEESLTPDQTTSSPRLGDRLGSGIKGDYPYLAVMVDPETQDGSTGTLHLMHSGLIADPISVQTAHLLFYPYNSKEAPIAPYLAPAPEEDSGLHNYTVLLFEQLEEQFKLPEQYEKYMANEAEARSGFPLKQFVDETGLGEPISGLSFQEEA